jgi:hypothetical protein
MGPKYETWRSTHSGRFATVIQACNERVLSFDVARFEPLGAQISIFPGFFVLVLVLVLSFSGTRTRRYRNDYEIEYEYHFIEYEYERKPP